MTDTGPLWLRAVFASIPLLVALLSGGFLLINTVNRRTERLKNLVEIHKGFPHALNQDYAVERLMFRELNTIERSTTPWYVWSRRMTVFGLAVIYAVSVPYIFNLFNYNTTTRLASQVVTYGMALMMVVVAVAVLNRRIQMRAKHRARFELLDSLAALPERRDTASPPTDADESQPANHTNNTTATDSTCDTDTTPRAGD